jgi:hypothetical protein
MKRHSFLVVFLACFVFVCETLASPVMIYMKGSNAPIALIRLEDASDGNGCEDHLGFFAVDSVAYDGVSEIVGGIRVKAILNPMSRPKDDDVPFLIRIDTSKLDEVDKGWLSTLVKKGSKLLIAFRRCGSGGFDSARDIYKADSLKW